MLRLLELRPMRLLQVQHFERVDPNRSRLERRLLVALLAHVVFVVPAVLAVPVVHSAVNSSRCLQVVPMLVGMDLERPIHFQMR
jgi:hypothetical protein